MATAQDYLGNTKWVEKMKQGFTFHDRNKNGYLSEGEFLLWVDNLKQALNPDPQDVERLRASCLKLSAVLGAKPGGKLSQDEFLKGAAEFAANKESHKVLDEMEEAYYAVMDINKDGKLSLEEYIKVGEAGKMSAEMAKVKFDTMDKNHNGKIDVKDVIAIGHKFWFE